MLDDESHVIATLYQFATRGKNISILGEFSGTCFYFGCLFASYLGARTKRSRFSFIRKKKGFLVVLATERVGSLIYQSFDERIG